MRIKHFYCLLLGSTLTWSFYISLVHHFFQGCIIMCRVQFCQAYAMGCSFLLLSLLWLRHLLKEHFIANFIILEMWHVLSTKKEKLNSLWKVVLKSYACYCCLDEWSFDDDITFLEKKIWHRKLCCAIKSFSMAERLSRRLQKHEELSILIWSSLFYRLNNQWPNFSSATIHYWCIWCSSTTFQH